MNNKVTTIEQERIVREISKEQGVSEREVNKVIDLYYKGISELVETDKPCEIRMSFLGTLTPTKTFIKKLNEADNTGG